MIETVFLKQSDLYGNSRIDIDYDEKTGVVNDVKIDINSKFYEVGMVFDKTKLSSKDVLSASISGMTFVDKNFNSKVLFYSRNLDGDINKSR